MGDNTGPRCKTPDWVRGRAARNEAGCLIWLMGTAKSGYGQFRHDGKVVLAHRWLYEQEVGPIPKGLHLDHLCHNYDITCHGGDSCTHRSCIDPDHLEPVTSAVNSARALDPRRNPNCPKGHPFVGANLIISSQGVRQCRTCKRLQKGSKDPFKYLAPGAQAPVRHPRPTLSADEMALARAQRLAAVRLDRQERMRRLSDGDIAEAFRRNAAGESCRSIARSFGTGQATITALIRGDSWQEWQERRSA